MTCAPTYAEALDALVLDAEGVTRARKLRNSAQGFMSVDPLAQIAPGWTPYRFGFNNTIYYNDPRGAFEKKFGARLYKFFKGGDEIGYDPNKKEYYVGTAGRDSDAAVYKRVFGGNQDNPGGGILNAIDAYPSGLGYAGQKYLETGDEIETSGDVIAGVGILMTPYAPTVGPEVTTFGAGVSLYGVGHQMADIALSDNPNTTRDIINKAVVEALPIGVVGAVGRKIDKMPIADLDKVILKSIAEGKGYLLEKTSEAGINSVIDQIFNKMEQSPIRNTPISNTVIIQH